MAGCSDPAAMRPRMADELDHLGRCILHARTYDDEVARLRVKRLGQHVEAERGAHRPAILGQHSDVVDGFGCLLIGDLERGGNGEAHRPIARGDDEADLCLRMSEIDAYMTFRSPAAKPT